MKKPYHYFAASPAGETISDDLEACLRCQRKKDEKANVKNCNVYRVPGHATGLYKVRFYVPNVKDVEHVAMIIYGEN